MSKRIDFYAFRSDLLLVLNLLESKELIEYTLAVTSGSPELIKWQSAANIKGLSTATDAQNVSGDYFLITMRGTPVVTRTVNLVGGGVTYPVDQMMNPDSVVLHPGGDWEGKLLLSGDFATLSFFPNAQRLMSAIRNLMRKHFARVNAYWVGPEALSRLRMGYRLTMAEQCPAEYNLREPPFPGDVL